MRVLYSTYKKGFPGNLDGKESARNAEEWGSIPGSERSPEEVNGNPLQYFCPENSIDRGAWWATVHGVTKSQKRPSDFHFTSLHIHLYTHILHTQTLYTHTHTHTHTHWKRKWQPTPVSLPGKSHGQRRLASYSPWGYK